MTQTNPFMALLSKLNALISVLKSADIKPERQEGKNLTKELEELKQEVTRLEQKSNTFLKDLAPKNDTIATIAIKRSKSISSNDKMTLQEIKNSLREAQHLHSSVQKIMLKETKIESKSKQDQGTKKYPRRQDGQWLQL